MRHSPKLIFLSPRTVSEIPLWEHADVNFHQLAVLISAAAGLAACALSFFLMWMHALNYTKPAEQRKCV